MTPPKYPLIRKWLPGLAIFERCTWQDSKSHIGWQDDAILAHQLNDWLANNGTEVFDGSNGLGIEGLGTKWSACKYDEKDHLAISSNFSCSRQTGLLIGIQPIQKPKVTMDEIDCCLQGHNWRGEKLDPIDLLQRILEAGIG